jgi:hypothetical protein
MSQVQRPARAVAAAVGTLLVAAACLLPSLGVAQERRTHLVGIEQGSSQSSAARSLGRGGYELSDGTWIDFGKWYDARWIDMSVTFLTELDRKTGIIWGLSTGEKGEKYVIDPGLHLGLVHMIDLDENTQITFSMRTVLWGDLRERSCIADYGEIGGVQRVNCRLAATPLPPEETLAYLLKRRGLEDTRVSIRIEHRF